MRTTIIIKTLFEGVHYYSTAPEEVKYLSMPHRHIFGVNVELEVFNDDREIEFIMFKHKINNWLKERCDSQGVWQMGTLSCEQVSKQLITYISEIVEKIERRYIRVMVDEDGENGAAIEKYKEEY